VKASRPVVSLAAALAPSRAAVLLGRHPGVSADEVAALLALGRPERLRLLADVLRGRAGAEPHRGGPPADDRTQVRQADPSRRGADEEPDASSSAWRVLPPRDVFPFDLKPVSPALAEVDGSLRALGERAARSAEIGLASVLGSEVSLLGRLLPGVPEPAATALVPVELTALAGQAVLAVDCGFAARLAERVAGAERRVPVASSLGPAARAVVELAVLGALDGIAAETDIETALAPRLGLREGMPDHPLCVELTISALGTRGRALLLLPRDALRALSRTVELPDHLGSVAVTASLLGGAATLDRADVDSLRPGDVLILDAPPGEDASLRLPGGLVASGRLDDDSLEVEEVEMRSPVLAAGEHPVVVDVELASVPVALRDVARIAPGAVLVLGLDRDGQVTLRIGDRRVARGELVEIDGAVGVRVLALEPPR
jgi:type III secretion protein Q